MDMPQCPVVVIVCLEIFQGAGGITFMAFTAGSTGVQESDIDTTGLGGGVVMREVVVNGC